jgi:glycerate kinase
VLVGSDGGDGLLDALGGRLIRQEQVTVSDPLGKPTEVAFGWLGSAAAVVESRLVCGLSLLAPGERNPLVTTTYGLGQLISAVVARGAAEVFVGLGGSATMDGGVGMARAWDWRPRDAAGRALPHGGGALSKLERLEPGKAPAARLVGLCDVTNPLTGRGGARVYARQKGATPAEEEHLASGLERLAAVAAKMGGAGLAGRSGAGAAGGLGFGVLFFGNGTLSSGANWVLDRIGFVDALAQADLVVTCEGEFDATSREGKLTGQVLSLAGRAQVPALLIAPKAQSVPDGVHVESGGGIWSAGEIEHRAGEAVARVLRLLAC